MTREERAAKMERVAARARILASYPLPESAEAPRQDLIAALRDVWPPDRSFLDVPCPDCEQTHPWRDHSDPAIEAAGLDVERLADALFYLYGNVTKYGASVQVPSGPTEGHRARAHWVGDAAKVIHEYNRLALLPTQASERKCFSCGTPDHFAGDRTHPCLPTQASDSPEKP